VCWDGRCGDVGAVVGRKVLDEKYRYGDVGGDRFRW